MLELFSKEIVANYTRDSFTVMYLILDVFPTLTKHASLICYVNISNVFSDNSACCAKVGDKPKNKVQRQ